MFKITADFSTMLLHYDTALFMIDLVGWHEYNSVMYC